jgi:hypothetical protein
MNSEKKRQVPLEKWLWDLARVLRGMSPYDRSFEHRLAPVAWVAAMLCQDIARAEYERRSEILKQNFNFKLLSDLANAWKGALVEYTDHLTLIDAINLHEGEEDDEWLAQPEFYDEAARALRPFDNGDAESPPYSLHGLLCFMRNEFKAQPGFEPRDPARNQSAVAASGAAS